jgi:putative salt-induced outer membrane protein
MKKISTLILVAILPLFAEAQTAAEVVDKFLSAAGGEDKISAIKAFQYKRSYKANAATDYNEEVTIASGENKFSRKKSILERDFYYVLNGNAGWLKIPMGSRDKAPTYTTKDLNEKEKGDLMLEVIDGLMPFYNYEAKGYKLVGGAQDATIDGKLISKLTIEKTGIKREYYFDKSNGLLVREIWIVNGITHTLDHKKYIETKLGVKVPVESNYINTKDKRNTAVATEWILENPTQGVSFIK